MHTQNRTFRKFATHAPTGAAALVSAPTSSNPSTSPSLSFPYSTLPLSSLSTLPPFQFPLQFPLPFFYSSPFSFFPFTPSPYRPFSHLSLLFLLSLACPRLVSTSVIPLFSLPSPTRSNRLPFRSFFHSRSSSPYPFLSIVVTFFVVNRILCLNFVSMTLVQMIV